VDTRARRSSTRLGPLAALLAALSVAGCMVGPDYRRPDAKPVQQFKYQVGPSEATSIADLPWWQVFNDKALQALITEGLSNSYDLQVATARIEEANQQVAIARSALLPQVGYQAFAARQKEFIPIEQIGNITFNTFGLAVNAAWEADVWGRIRRSTEAARAGLYAQEDVRRAVMLSLVSDIASAYFLLIELDRELAIAHSSSDTYKQTLELFTLRFQGGKDTKLAVDRAQAAYDGSQASIAGLERAIAQTQDALCVLLGAYPRTIARGTGLTEQTMPPQTPVGLTTALLERRPDILQAEQVMIGANAEIGVAVANFYPVIGLSALFGGEGQHPSDIFKSNFSIWSIAAGLTGPIFQGGRLEAAYHAQQHYWDETIAQYRKTVITAFQETSDALIAQQTLVGQRAALEDQVAVLKESVDLALDRYRAGKASYLDVLDAEQQLFPSEDVLAQTQRDQLLAVVNLYKALGGGWSLKDAEWTQPH
jgi:outer membrane protein, multidrug efflux system